MDLDLTGSPLRCSFNLHEDEDEASGMMEDTPRRRRTTGYTRYVPLSASDARFGTVASNQRAVQPILHQGLSFLPQVTVKSLQLPALLRPPFVFHPRLLVPG